MSLTAIHEGIDHTPVVTTVIQDLKLYRVIKVVYIWSVYCVLILPEVQEFRSFILMTLKLVYTFFPQSI